ncbi:MAG TPA: thioredoxin domain-containing protein, partial [Bryobacteraceae bacterium]
SAPVRIEIFSDFQCPGCKAFHEVLLPVIMRDYVVPGKAYIYNHEFPLAMHPHSREAAQYAVAAATVGKYVQVADALFHNQTSWAADGKVWETVAAVLTPAEQKKVQVLAKDPAIIAQVQQEADSGQAQKIPQTPTVIVSRGAKRYTFPGPDPNNYALLRSLIDGLLK